VTADRDVAAFSRRAGEYDSGAVGKWHQDLAARVRTIAVQVAPSPLRVLDIGSGTGHALALMARAYPSAVTLIGLEPAPGMLTVARGSVTDSRIHMVGGVAERLPFVAGQFDVITATTTFDHWQDQAGGLAECRRVMSPGAALILTDLVGLPLTPTLAFRPGKARSRGRVTRLLLASGLSVEKWRRTYGPIVQTVIARGD
jgi:ubiquinone/menaquinone biosynthesis C-methylase UbiE